MEGGRLTWLRLGHRVELLEENPFPKQTGNDALGVPGSSGSSLC